MFSGGAIYPFSSSLDPPSNRIKCFGIRALTSLIPLCPSPKTEKKLKIFKTSFLIRKQKKRNTSHTQERCAQFKKYFSLYLGGLYFG